MKRIKDQTECMCAAVCSGVTRDVFIFALLLVDFYRLIGRLLGRHQLIRFIRFHSLRRFVI
jgi:hypothetical protein